MDKTLSVAPRIDEESFEFRSGRPVVGHIFLEIAHGDFFPEWGWDDFPVVVLLGLLGALVSIAKGDTSKAEINFFEGPFAIHLESYSAPGKLRIAFLRNDHEVKASGVLNLRDFLLSSMQLATRILHLCEDKGFTDKDIEKLKVTLAECKMLEF